MTAVVPDWTRKCDQIAKDFNLLILHGLGPIDGAQVDTVFRSRLNFVPRSVVPQVKPARPTQSVVRESGCVNRSTHILGSAGLGHELAVLWVALARVLWWRER